MISLIAVVIGLVFIFQGWSGLGIPVDPLDPFGEIARAIASNKVNDGLILLLPGVVVFVYLKIRS